MRDLPLSGWTPGNKAIGAGSARTDGQRASETNVTTALQLGRLEVLRVLDEYFEIMESQHSLEYFEIMES